MTRSVFVHIGFPKTGTTSIQKSLAASRKSLFSRGLIYPGSEDDQANIVALFHPKGAEHFYFSEKKDFSPLDAASTLMTEALSFDGDTIISSEYLYDLGQQYSRKLYNAFSKEGFRVKFICYVRHPVDAAISSAQQSIKMGQRSLSDVIDQPRYAQIKRNILPIVQAVGKENVTLIDFRSAVSSGLLASFVQAIGKPDILDSLTEIKANESLSMDGAILADIHRTYHAETGKYLFPKSIIFKIQGEKFDLPEATKNKVREEGKSDCDWVQNEFNLSLQEPAETSGFRARVNHRSLITLIESLRSS